METPTPPGYTRLVALDREKHRGLGPDTARGYGFAREMGAVYITAPEFIQAARHFPIVFAKDPGTAEFVPLAVMGFDGSTNLFVDAEGAWEADAYVPAYIRRWPFYVVSVRQESGDETRDVICADEPALVQADEPIIDDAGEMTDAWEPYARLVEEMQKARAQTVGLAKTLDRLDLLVPFEAHAHPKSGKQMRLRGLFRVDESRLNELPAKDLKRMMKRGELSRTYAHMMSLDNFKFLLDRDAAARGAITEAAIGRA